MVQFFFMGDTVALRPPSQIFMTGELHICSYQKLKNFNLRRKKHSSLPKTKTLIYYGKNYSTTVNYS